MSSFRRCTNLVTPAEVGGLVGRWRQCVGSLTYKEWLKQSWWHSYPEQDTLQITMPEKIQVSREETFKRKIGEYIACGLVNYGLALGEWSVKQLKL